METQSLCFVRRGSIVLSWIEAAQEEYIAGLKLAIERGWLELHKSATFVRFTQDGAELFA
jgi:hypothetical protein